MNLKFETQSDIFIVRGNLVPHVVHFDNSEQKTENPKNVSPEKIV